MAQPIAGQPPSNRGWDVTTRRSPETPELWFAAQFPLYAILIGGVITWFFGGKWVWRLWLATMLGIILYLFFGLRVTSGMEGMAFITIPLFGVAVGLGGFLGWALARVLKDAQLK